MNRHIHAKMVQTIAEDTAIDLLRQAGYQVYCNPNHGTIDITVNGTLQIEIKGALWTKHKHSKGRYQFNTRQDADVYILCCFGALNRFFVVPGRVIGKRANIAIWSEFPSRYVGRWSEYCDAWHIIDKELDRCQNPTA